MDRFRRARNVKSTGAAPDRLTGSAIPFETRVAKLRAETAAAPPAVSAMRPTTISLQRATVVGVEPGSRRSEGIGTETYDFDNSGSSSTSEEMLQITNETQFVMVIDGERSSVKGGNSTFGITHFASIEGQVQNTLRNHYSVEATSKLTVERSTRISIPPRTHVRVTLNWKRVWQDGVINLRPPSGHAVAVPYSVTVDLSFDKKTVDVE